MKTASRMTGLLAMIALVLAARSRAEEPEDEPQVETKKLNDVIEGSIDWYDLYPDPSAKDPMRPQPVLRWRNVARGQEGEAMMVVWAHRGRPLAIASIYPWQGYLNHEFGSLSRSAQLLARDNGNVAWSPKSPGVELRPVPDAPPPAETPAARLRQLKSIAGRFKATMTGWKGDNSDREELRLLPRPLYRYSVTDPQDGEPAVLDGALFAFVMGTDPETVMLLEAVGTQGSATWQYAFVRATSGGLEVRLENEVAWRAEKFQGPRSPTDTTRTLARILPR